MPKAIIIGTSTGIGRALAFELHRQGWEIAITGRHPEALDQIRKELGGSHVHLRGLDLRGPETAMETVCELIDVMGGLDLMIVNAGILPINPQFDWAPEIEGVRVNIIGFQAMCHVACHYFENQGHGHLAGISSIAALRGTGRAPVYNASKAFMVNYMEGLRQRYYKTKIHITDLRPGFIETQMIAGRPGLFWVVSAERAARDIVKAIHQKKKVAYVPGRWWWIAQIWKILPEFIYHRAYQKYVGRPDYHDFPETKMVKDFPKQS